MDNFWTVLSDLIGGIIFVLFVGCVCLAMLCSTGCDQPRVSNTRTKDVTRVNGDQWEHISTIEYDGCEYVLYRGYRSAGLTHKGNCKSPAHSQPAPAEAQP